MLRANPVDRAGAGSIYKHRLYRRNVNDSANNTLYVTTASALRIFLGTRGLGIPKRRGLFENRRYFLLLLDGVLDFPLELFPVFIYIASECKMVKRLRNSDVVS